MLRSNLGLLFGSCAAVAVGVVGGWTALALRAPVSPEAVSSPAPAPRAPEPAATGEVARPPAAAVPPTATEKAPPRERNAAASGPTGLWIDHTGRGAVEITECAGGLCGRIVWLKDAGNASACGTQVIGNAKRTSAGTWDGGWIYDPDKDARYSVELKPIGTDKLRVMGYMGSKLFSETFTWKRPTADIKRCDAPATAATPAPAAGDAKPAPTEITKAEPSPEPAPDAPPGKSPKSGNGSMGDLEKIAREMIKTKPGGKDCTVKLPYVGTVTVPCPG